MVLSSRGSPIPPPPAFAAAKSRAEPSRPFEKQRMRRSCAQIHARIRSLRGERLAEARQVAPCLRLDKCPQLIPAYPVTHQSLRRPHRQTETDSLGSLSFQMTHKEHNAASALKERFFLLVVRNFRETPNHTIFQRLATAHLSRRFGYPTQCALPSGASTPSNSSPRGQS